MARRVFEQTGLIPRSIIRTFDRFRKQLFKGGKTAVIQEFRVSRYQVIVSVKCLLSLIFIPLTVNFLARTYFLKPVIEYLWNTQQTEIFLNVYQENRAFSELHDFEEKLFFESLIETEPVPEQSHSHEKIETKRNQFGDFCFVNNANEKTENLYKTPIKNNKKVLHQLLFTPKILKSDSKNYINDARASLLCSNSKRDTDAFLLQTFTNQKFLRSQESKQVFTENIQQKMKFPNFSQLLTVDLLAINRFKENEIETPKNKNFSYKAKLSKKSQKASLPCSSCWLNIPKKRKFEWFTCSSNFFDFLPTQKNTLDYNQSLSFFLKEKTNLVSLFVHPSLSYHVDQIESYFCEKMLESKVAQPFYLENSLTQKFQQKTIELAIYYNQQSIQALINFFGDLFTFFTLTFLFVWMEPQIIILKSFLIESIYSFSDTTKSFLLILITDLLVGFHSPHGWEILLELILRHLGLPESQNFIFVFVATFPVLLDTLFKYWIFRFLNRISPSTVVTYHNMIE